MLTWDIDQAVSVRRLPGQAGSCQVTLGHARSSRFFSVRSMVSVSQVKVLQGVRYALSDDALWLGRPILKS